ncbi:hypothetical protein O3P69_005330 [Scylla paramamosain]|uniref:Uncharacterized protein n=1 Tax=Scylla paramamosain TaxID=85552 RepID=A0AAW0U7X8_SCYPA
MDSEWHAMEGKKNGGVEMIKKEPGWGSNTSGGEAEGIYSCIIIPVLQVHGTPTQDRQTSTPALHDQKDEVVVAKRHFTSIHKQTKRRTLFSGEKKLEWRISKFMQRKNMKAQECKK